MAGAVAERTAGAVAGRLERIKERGGIKGRDVAQLLDITPETVSRWKKGRVAPHRARLQRLLALEFLLDELAEFYPPDEARLWLFSPHRLLGGAKPADLIHDDKIDDVLALVDQLRDGAYV